MQNKAFQRTWFVRQKNEQEKQYLKKQDTAHSQEDLAQRLQEKTDRVNGLKDVYKKQEQVIRKLERLVGGRSSRDDGNDNDQVSSLRQQLQASQHRIESLEKRVRRTCLTSVFSYDAR